jgi:sirohydrochlorin ferrochelatase
MSTGIIIVDHGSRRFESNDVVEEVAARFAATYPHDYPIVEPAHMELAEPSIATAFARCIRRGARRVVIMPFFLGPGKHWNEDIPRLVQDAHKHFPEVETAIAQPLGIDDLLLRLIAQRIDERLSATPGERSETVLTSGMPLDDRDDRL